MEILDFVVLFVAALEILNMTFCPGDKWVDDETCTFDMELSVLRKLLQNSYLQNSPDSP